MIFSLLHFGKFYLFSQVFMFFMIFLIILRWWLLILWISFSNDLLYLTIILLIFVIQLVSKVSQHILDLQNVHHQKKVINYFLPSLQYKMVCHQDYFSQRNFFILKIISFKMSLNSLLSQRMFFPQFFIVSRQFQYQVALQHWYFFVEMISFWVSQFQQPVVNFFVLLYYELYFMIIFVTKYQNVDITQIKMIHLNKNQPNEKRLPNMTIDTSKPYQHKQIDTRWVELKVNHKLSPRAYFGSCIQAGKVFIHGGYNEEKGILSDMYEAQFYSLPTEWIQIKPKNKKNKGPPALRNHTLCAYTAYLILFGGQKNMLQNNNEIYRYDMRTNEWDILKQTFVQSSSKINLSLDSHIAHIYNDYMYVFGGYQSQKGLYFNHLLQINLKNVAQGDVLIKQVQVNNQPSPRGNMSSTIIDHQMFIFGGTNSDQIFDDLWIFNFEKLEWKQVAKPLKQQSLEWPQKRKGQTMSAHAKSRAIFMFGGIKQITKQQNDIMVFLVSKMKWVRIHKNTNELYEPSPTIKKQIQTSPSIIDARERKLNSNSKSKSRTKSQPKSPFKLAIKSVTCYNKSMTQATQIQANFNMTHKPLKTQVTTLVPTQKKRIMSIMQQKKNREFLLRKKKLLSAINQSPQSLIHRPHSPTSQSLQYSLNTIGQQKISSSKQQDNLPKVIFDADIGQVIGKKPCARDGHAGLVFQDGILIIGGDRHMMAFGDVFRFRMDKAIQNIHLYQ